MSQEPLYRRIPEEGKHPANSKRTPGAISGAALNDETNRPSGSSDFMPVEGLTEEEYLRRQREAAFWGEFTTIIMDWAYDKTMDWLEDTFLKTVRDVVTIPAWNKNATQGEFAAQTPPFCSVFQELHK